MPNLFNKINIAKKAKPDQSPINEVENEELFISIILSDQELQSALVSKNQEIKKYSSIKSYFDRQDLLTQLDSSLQDLGPAAEEVADCVFIFDETWLKDGDLLDSKRVIVKELADSLSLSPLGQMSISDAIHQARVAKDSHDSSLSIYLREKDFDLLLIKHGQLLANLKVGRSAKLSDDLQEGLARISQDLVEKGKYFPNKVFITSLNLPQKTLVKEQAMLQNFDWTQISGFLQVPEFVVLETDFLIKALSIAASQMLLKDLILSPDQETEAIKEEKVKEQEPSVSSFGIDLSDTKTSLELKKQAISSDNLQTQEPDADDLQDEPVNEVLPARKMTKKRWIINARRFFEKNRKPILIGGGFGLLLVILVFLMLTSLMSVTVKLTPNVQILQKNLEITLDPKLNESDFSKNLLKASLVQKEVSGKDTLSTTGISLVGDKAKGEVELFNKTFTDKTFAAKTNLIYEEVVFTLDEELTIPGAEEKDGGRGIDYGSEKVAITAKDIGAEANIKKDSKLKIADFSEDTYSATAIDNFSGGSSREVRVVSKDDLDKLLNQLKTKLNDGANNDFAQESTAGVYFVPTGNSQIKTSDYDHKEADEVETLSLTMTLEVEAIKYLSSDLKQLAEAVLLLDLPENYNFVDEEPSLLSDQAKAKGDDNSRLVLDAELSAKAKANVDEESLKNLILGKSLVDAKSKLLEDGLIKQVEITVKPSFMKSFLKKIPKDAQRLNLIID